MKEVILNGLSLQLSDTLDIYRCATNVNKWLVLDKSFWIVCHVLYNETTNALEIHKASKANIDIQPNAPMRISRQ